MKFLATLAVLVAFALTAPAAGPTYYLVDGVVTAEGIPPQALPTAATFPVAAPPACYVDANGNTVCPSCPQAKPTACFAGGCPCLPAKTPFDSATNCGTYSCPANGGAGGCPCSIPQPMAGPGPTTHAGGSFFLNRHPHGAVRSFFSHRPHLLGGGLFRFCR